MTILLSGGFLAGLIIPHENGFAISLVEKLEDLVCIIFMPIVCSDVQHHIQDINYLLVLCTIWLEDKSWPLGQWYYMGLRRHYLYHGFLQQVFVLRHFCQTNRFQLA